MIPGPKSIATAALAALLSGALDAQEVRTDPQSGVRYYPGTFLASEHRGDVDEFVFTGGVRYVDPRIGLDVRCDRALVVVDRQQAGASARELDRDGGLPRRGPELPDSRRTLGEDVLRARMSSFLTALRQRPVEPAPLDVDLELFRSIYLEGDVSVVQDGVEVVRAKSLYFSPSDDRAVLRGVELRLRDVDKLGRSVQVTVRTDELVRQRGRMVGRDVSVTTCPAGRPQFEVLSGEVEILERADAFEIRARDNALAFSQTRVLPLPDQSYVTGEQTNLPIRSLTAGHSNKEGLRAGVILGGSFNDLGGALHERLTGRPREEFRGDWELGVEWIQERGFPIDAELEYRGGDIYEGQALGFFLDDQGDNIRDIRNYIDGTPIDEDSRSVVWTENRVHLGERTTVDLTVFDASDPAVWSEFYRDRYYLDERPETSLHARHAQDNWIVTATGRWDLAGFSYADGRQLAPRFVEEVPNLTFDWFSEPIVELPGETPLLVTSSTGIALLRSAWDDRFATPVDDETWRIDSDLELAAPFHAGPLGIRPYADARFTHYQNDVAGESHNRWSFAAGLEVGSRLSRTWEWTGADGTSEALRHVVSPTVRFEHRYRVDGDPGDFPQFDPVDALDEGANIRVGILQRFQRRSEDDEGTRDVREWIWLDLAQNFTPISDRDNDGHHLGLAEFELMLRPQEISENVQLGIGTEGEHDWNTDRLRTFNNYVRVKTAAVTWTGQYRSDETARGQIGYGVSVPTRKRWVVSGFGLYDLETKDNIRYSARLLRRDLNWNLILEVAYDVVTDDTSLRFAFEPSFGGIVRKRDRFAVGGYDFSAGNALMY